MRKPARDSGFTLIEIMVVLALMGIIADLRGRQLAGMDRGVQREGRRCRPADGHAADPGPCRSPRAWTSASTSTPSAGTYTIYRDGRTAPTPFTCVAPGRRSTARHAARERAPEQRGLHPTRRRVGTARSSSAPRGGLARGLVITRDGSSKTYTINVEGLTGRVSFS